MNNNDVLRRIRYTFDFNDATMMKLFDMGGTPRTREEISDWLKKDEDPAFVGIYDKDLAVFLNGFIILKRGKREGPQPKPEKTLNNNLILRKLKIALNLKDVDVLEMLKSVDFYLSKHELSAFFRKPTQSQYRLCKDQVLRNVLHGIQIKYRKS